MARKGSSSARPRRAADGSRPSCVPGPCRGPSTPIGHTAAQAALPSGRRAIAVGAGRTLDPDWMKGRPGGWENELLVAYLLPAGHVAVYSVPLVGGAFLWGGKVYR